MTVLRYIKTPLIDIIASALLWWGTSIASAVIQPAHVGFSCDDVSIRKPRVPEIVSSMLLHWVTLLVPILCFVMVELVKIYLIDQDEEFADGEIRQSKLTRVLLRVLHVISWHFLTMAITELLTTVAKLSVGRLRPYFLEVCRPAVDTESCATRPIYITHYECTDPHGSSVGARKSFFSGHSSNSMAAATFVVLYIQGRLVNDCQGWGKTVPNRKDAPLSTFHNGYAQRIKNACSSDRSMGPLFR
uniref:AcidPPc domain-containing protein n=1 Tax=Panagrellus redivivus TaxID=6233 RepID=A0A7E4VBL2_PANRE